MCKKFMKNAQNMLVYRDKIRKNNLTDLGENYFDIVKNTKKINIKQLYIAICL